MAETNYDLSQSTSGNQLYTLERLTSLQQGSKCFTHCRAQVSSGQRGDIFLPNVAHSLVNITCVVCKKVFTNYTDWDAHADQMLRDEDSEHSEIFKIQKVVSKEAAGSYEKLLGEFSCEMCNKSFSQFGELQDHISNNFSYVQLICSQCGGQFCNIDSHFHQHFKEQYCGECGKSYVDLKTHVKDFHRGFLSVLVLNTTSCGGTKGIRFLKQIMFKTGMRFMPEEIRPAETQQKPQIVQMKSTITDFFSSFDPFSGQERPPLDSPALSSTPRSVIIPSKTNSQSVKNTLFVSPPPPPTTDTSVPGLPPTQGTNVPILPPRGTNVPILPPPRKKDSSLPWDHGIRPQPSSLSFLSYHKSRENALLKQSTKAKEKTKSKDESDGDKNTSNTSLHENLQEVVEAVGEKNIKLEPMEEVNKELPSGIAQIHPKSNFVNWEEKRDATIARKSSDVVDKNDSNIPVHEKSNKAVGEKVSNEIINKNIKLEPMEEEIDNEKMSSEISAEINLLNREQSLDTAIKTKSSEVHSSIVKNIKLENPHEIPIKHPSSAPPSQEELNFKKQKDNALKTSIKTEVEPVIMQTLKLPVISADAKINKSDIEAIKKQTIKTLTAAKLNKIKDPNLLKQVKSMIMQLKSKIGPNDKKKTVPPIKTETPGTLESTETSNLNIHPDLTKPPNDLTKPTNEKAKLTNDNTKLPNDLIKPSIDLTNHSNLTKTSNDQAKPPNDLTVPLKDLTEPLKDLTEPLNDVTIPSSNLTKLSNVLTESPNHLSNETNDITKPPNQLPGLSFDESGKRIWDFQFLSSCKSFVCEFCGFQTVEENSTTKFNHIITWHFKERYEIEIITTKAPIDHATIDEWTKDALKELSVEGSSLRDNTFKDIIEKHQVESAMHTKDGKLIRYKLVPYSSDTPANNVHGPSNMCELCGFKTDSKLKMSEQNKMKIDHMVLYHFQLRVDAILPKEPPFNCPGELEGQWEGKFAGQTYQQCWNISKKGKKTREDLVRHYLGTHGMLYKWTKDFTEDVKKGVESLDKIMKKHKVEHALSKEMHTRKFKLVFQTEALEQKDNEIVVQNKQINAAARPALKLVKHENLVIKNDSEKLSNDTTDDTNNENDAALKKSETGTPSKPTQLQNEDVLDTDRKSWRFKCNFCIRKFVSQSAVDSHEKISHRVLFQANSKSRSVSASSNPETQTHPGENSSKKTTYKSQQRVTCDICLKSCCNKSYLIKHKKNKHGVESNNENTESDTSKNEFSETSMDESDITNIELGETNTEFSDIRKRKLESEGNNADNDDIIDGGDSKEVDKDEAMEGRNDTNETLSSAQKVSIDERLTRIKRMRFCRVQLTSAGFGGIYM